MPRVVPLPPTGPELGDGLRRLQDDAVARPTTTTKDRVQSARTDRQAYRLGEGDHRKSRFQATERVDVTGDGPATCTVRTPVALGVPIATFTGVRLDSSVDVPATGVLFLTGCQITAAVNVAAGGIVHATACHFSGVGAIINAGAIGNAYITNCHNTSTVAHVNVVVISQTV